MGTTPDEGADGDETRPASANRDDRDIFRLAPSMDADVLATIAARLEFRGTDDGYARLSQAYFSRLDLADAPRVLALGCGTGIEVRALGRITAPGTSLVGVDHSAVLIDAARRLTAEEGLGDGISYEVGDAHHTRFADGEFDIVILHTVISHVEDPVQVLREARRIVRPGGTIAVFDGDYASLTFAHPDHALATTIEEQLIQLIVANPRVMRDMPRLVHRLGLELVDADATVYANIGGGRFWPGAADAYGLLLGRSGVLPAALVEDWRAFQSRSVADNTFFGASNYYTYLTRRPDPESAA
jgi:ubiquinone/menaquinone biosynthesis C-methylase UbiE